jgi:sugar transferase (PEP-CTERM system associated)
VIRLFNAYFPARVIFLGVSEGVLVILAFTASTIIWIGAFDANTVLLYDGGLLKIFLVSAIFILCMYYFDLYDTLVLSNRREVLTRLLQVLGSACFVLAMLYAAYPALRLGRSVFVTGFAFVAICLAVWRRCFLLLNRSPRLAQRAIILGQGPLTEALATEIQRREELGVRVLGYVDSAQENGWRRDDLRCLGTIEALPELVGSQRVARVIVAMADRRGKLPVEALLKLKPRGVLILDGAEYFENITGKVPLEAFRLSWLLFSPGFHVSRSFLVCKRMLSLMFASIGLMLCLPIMALVALLIRLDSRGPIIFRQQRLGKDGKLFTLYKFRSMHDGADSNGKHTPAQTSDSRVTRLGNWLRRMRLDELPQLYNILRGDMYFVGPRPFVPDQEEELVQQIPFYHQRWTVRPGATGWAQVHRGYCASMEDNAEKLAYDLFYIKNMSIGLDLLILFLTVKILLLGRGGR